MCVEGHEFHYEEGTNNTLVCTFGSGVKQFHNSMSGLNAHKAYCTDHTWMWWHCPNVYESIKQELEDLITHITPKRTVFIGTSMGGLGAIEYATVFPCNEVILFSPQVYPEQYFINTHEGQEGWPAEKVAILESMKPYKNAIDMLKDDITYTIYCGRTHKVDLHHVGLFPEQANIKKIFINCKAHNTAGKLKRRGKLPSIIKEHVKEI